jgi:hypothetical protein
MTYKEALATLGLSLRGFPSREQAQAAYEAKASVCARARDAAGLVRLKEAFVVLQQQAPDGEVAVSEPLRVPTAAAKKKRAPFKWKDTGPHQRIEVEWNPDWVGPLAQTVGHHVFWHAFVGIGFLVLVVIVSVVVALTTGRIPRWGQPGIGTHDDSTFQDGTGDDRWRPAAIASSECTRRYRSECATEVPGVDVVDAVCDHPCWTRDPTTGIARPIACIRTSIDTCVATMRDLSEPPSIARRFCQCMVDR